MPKTVSKSSSVPRRNATPVINPSSEVSSARTPLSKGGKGKAAAGRSTAPVVETPSSTVATKGKGKTPKASPAKPIEKTVEAPQGEDTTVRRAGRPRLREGQLRKPMVRVLQALAKGRPLTRNQISEAANVDLPSLSLFIGANDPEIRLANEEKKGVKGLITLKYVKGEEHDVEGRDTFLYSITALGKKALEKAEREEAKASGASAPKTRA